MIKILTHPVHTSYEYEMSKIGYRFHSLNFNKKVSFWDKWQRPQPSNWKEIEKFNEKEFDLVIVHTKEGFDYFKDTKLPMLYKLHTVDEPREVPKETLDRCKFLLFNNPEASDRWICDKGKKKVLGYSIDTDVFKDWEGKDKRILSVGNKMGIRIDKGTDKLLAVAQIEDVVLVGNGNDSVKFVEKLKSKSYDDIAGYYKQFRIFMNPADTFPMSSLEAMATGMPVATIEPKNSRKLLEDGENCLIADNVDELLEKIWKLLDNDMLCKRLGQNARQTIIEECNPKDFQRKWKEVIEETI